MCVTLQMLLSLAPTGHCCFIYLITRLRYRIERAEPVTALHGETVGSEPLHERRSSMKVKLNKGISMGEFFASDDRQVWEQKVHRGSLTALEKCIMRDLRHVRDDPLIAKYIQHNKRRRTFKICCMLVQKDGWLWPPISCTERQLRSRPLWTGVTIAKDAKPCSVLIYDSDYGLHYFLELYWRLALEAEILVSSNVNRSAWDTVLEPFCQTFQLWVHDACPPEYTFQHNYPILYVDVV